MSTWKVKQREQKRAHKTQEKEGRRFYLAVCVVIAVLAMVVGRLFSGVFQKLEDLLKKVPYIKRISEKKIVVMALKHLGAVKTVVFKTVSAIFRIFCSLVARVPGMCKCKLMLDGMKKKFCNSSVCHLYAKAKGYVSYAVEYARCLFKKSIDNAKKLR